ncbi:fumarate reductase subunit C [Klebsiella pneumoniae]|uniref:Fumarate reductase subunit C n=2 Tax=Klebsiella pneumoniae TaxID=573 RepID=A0A377XKW2_KLEPN|nr:fumarate reductase subunit C [Klebsiella pneumoniae]
MHYDDETQTLRATNDLHLVEKAAVLSLLHGTEGTAVPTVWFSIVLIYGLFALKHGAESWAGYIGFLQNPVVVILNLITLAAALLHTKTWFELAPKAANVIIKGEKMGPEPVIKGLWVVTAVVTVVILFVALFW